MVVDKVNKNTLRRIEFRRRDRRPLYQQLAEGIAEQIRDGDLKTGAKLPPLRELAQTQGIALVTASQAYEVLASEGLIEARSGRGTFVAYDVDRDLAPSQALDGKRNVTRVADAKPARESLAAETRRGSALQLLRSSFRPGTIVLSTGNTAPETYPVADFAQCYARTFLDDPPEVHQYRADRGDPELRALFAARLRSRGADVSPDDILVVSGAQQALSLVAEALINRGDAAVAEAPTYFSALEVFDQKNVSWVNARVDADGVVPGSLRDAIRRSSARIAYLNTAAQNPTGSYLARSRLREVLDAARKAQAIIIEDQSLWPISYDGEVPPPLLAADKDGRVVLIESMSKLYMPSLRIGYIAAKGKALQSLYAAKLRADAFTSTVAQRALVRFMQSKAAGRHMRATRFLYLRRRDALLTALRKALPPGASVLEPRGGVNLWIELPREWSALELLGYAAQEGVLFLTGEAFYPTQPPRNMARMSYGNLPDTLAGEAMARFGRAVRAYAQARRRSKQHDAVEESAISAAV